MHLANLAHNQTPCGIFFGFELIPNDSAMAIQALKKISLNLSCVIVIADIQAEALKNLVDVPVITLEDFEHFGEENFPVKPQEVFVPAPLADLAFFPYFKRCGIEIIAPTYTKDQQQYFL